jgi:hypothetical protein
MRDEWYFRVQGEVHGPVTRDELEQLAHSGAFGLGDKVRPGATGAWVTPSASLFPVGVVDEYERTAERRAQQEQAPAASHDAAFIPGFADRDFGELITRRRGSVSAAIISVCLAASGIFVTIGVAFYAAGAPLWLVPLLALGTASFSYSAWKSTVFALTVVQVYQHGLVQRSPSSEIRIAYADAVSLKYGVVRHFTNFAYSGTEIEFTVTSREGSRARLCAKYKEREASGSRLGSRAFVDRDQIDQLRVRASAAIADHMLAALESGASVMVGNDLQVVSAGITPLYGKRKGALIPWHLFFGSSMEKGALVLFDLGDERAHVVVAMSDENAWPFYLLLRTLAPNLAPST